MLGTRRRRTRGRRRRAELNGVDDLHESEYSECGCSRFVVHVMKNVLFHLSTCGTYR
jgi:hypothetical protein